jgi:SET domain-containing protein
LLPEYPYRLEVRPSPIDRRGCFAAEPLPAGAVLREYTGELITSAEAVRREADPSRPSVFTLWIDKEWVIDGAVGGNETIYINHSCAPNCCIEGDDQRLFICTLRPILAGEELTLDYAYDPATPLEPCACGAPECRGYINELPGHALPYDHPRD